MQQKSISIGLFILSMLGAYLLLSMLTIFVNNSVHGDSAISESGLKESFSESALLVESLPKPCDSEEVEEGKVCIGLYFDSSDHVTTSIVTADGNVEQLLPISGSGEAQTSEANQSSAGASASMADEEANRVDGQAHVSSEQEESSETTSQKSSDKIESPCVYVANNLYSHDTNDEDELIYSSDQELTDDSHTEYVWMDTDQPDIKDEHLGNSSNGVCVELYRDNGDGIADPSDDMFVGFTLMMDKERSESESYQFTNLPDGDYFAKFYPLGVPVSKSEEVIKKPTQEPTPSATIDIMSNDGMIENETKVNDNNNRTKTNTTSTNVRPTPSSNTTNRNTQRESQNDTQSNQSNFQSSTDKSNVNNSSTPAGNNSNTTQYNHNNGVEANRSDDDDSSNYNNSDSTEYNEQNRENRNNITAEPTAEVIYEPTAEPIYEPTAEVIYEPTVEVIYEPTAEPIYEPTAEPIYEPTAEVIYEPTAEPIYEPTAEPIYEPTAEVIYEPTYEPTAEPTYEPTYTYEPTVEPIYQDYNHSTSSESSDYESQDLTNQSTTDTSNTDTSTYSDSEPAVDRTNEEVEVNQNNSANKPLSSIQIQINPSNPDSSSPSTSGEENPTSNETESVDEGTNSESNNEVHQFQPARSDSESTPYPAPDETSSSSEGSLSPTTGLGFSIGREVGSDPAPADEDSTP